jgi:hypothetical protein
VLTRVASARLSAEMQNLSWSVPFGADSSCFGSAVGGDAKSFVGVPFGTDSSSV